MGQHPNGPAALQQMLLQQQQQLQYAQSQRAPMGVSLDGGYHQVPQQSTHELGGVGFGGGARVQGSSSPSVGTMPVVYFPVWVDDFAPEGQVTRWMSYTQLAGIGGTVGGYFFGGVFSRFTGPSGESKWRTPFFVQSVALIPVVLLLAALPASLNFSAALIEVKSLLRNPLYVVVTLGMSALYFVVTGIQFWVTEFLVSVLHFQKLSVVALSTFCFLTAPTSGVWFGGYVCDLCGGYRGGGQQRVAVRVTTLFAGIGATLAVSCIYVESFILFAILIWGCLFFGAALVPVAVGIQLASVPFHQRSISYNMFGWFSAPLVSGVVMDFIDWCHPAGGKELALRFGFEMILWVTLVGFVLFAVANTLTFPSEDIEKEELELQLARTRMPTLSGTQQTVGRRDAVVGLPLDPSPSAPKGAKFRQPPAVASASVWIEWINGLWFSGSPNARLRPRELSLTSLIEAMTGGPPASRQTLAVEAAAACEGASYPPSFASENSAALANMATPQGPPSESSSSPGSLKPLSPATPAGAPQGEGGPESKGKGPSCRARSSSSSVVSLMSEDGEAEEEAPPVVDLEGGPSGAPISSRPRRAAAMRSRKSATEATAAAATPPPVPAKYREELQQVDADITAILRDGLPSTDLVSNREAYLKVKEELEVPEGEEEAEGEDEQPLGTGLVLRIQRLLRQLCEGSPLPLSLLAEAASKALADGGPDGGAPVFSVDHQTLKVELPVLLTRRRFGLARPIEPAGGPSEGAPRGPPVGPLEDAAPYKLWVWESVLLDGLPVAFKEAARRDRENRQTINRRLRALEKLREALLSGVEADVAAARERVQQQLQREAAAAERKQQQENKRRQLEFARKERERERRQREEQKRQREVEREKKEREKQEEREKKEKEKEEQRLQKLQQQAEKQKEKKADPSVNRQQSLMASWLRRPAVSASPGGGPPGPHGGPLGGTQGSTSPSAAAGSGAEEQGSGGVVVVLDEEEQELLQERLEISRAAESEATAWKTAPEDRKEFVAAVEALAKSSQEQADSSDLLQQFLQKHAAPARASLQAFVCFSEHRRFEHKVTLQQFVGGAPEGESSSSSSSSSKGSGYRQTAAEVRKGLTLTDYCAESLPDAPFLRTSWVALDDWKRPVRRLLMGKKPKLPGNDELEAMFASVNLLFCGVQAATCCEQWAEESCVDYERDSDDEWFECFDADDLEDAKEEEEEEELEGDDDRDWLEDDEDAKDKLPAAPAIRFEAFLQWEFTFDGEPKPNEADCLAPLVAIPSLRDGSWCSAYGCVGDDWGGNPFARLDALPVHSRRKWSDEDSVNLLRAKLAFYDAAASATVASAAVASVDGVRATQFKLLGVREAEADLRSLTRWYATEEAARAFNLTKELDELLEAVRAEERLIEAKQQELAEQLKAQLAANNALFDNEQKKKEPTGGATAPSGCTNATAASSPPEASAAAGYSKDKSDAGSFEPPTGGSSKVNESFVRDHEQPRPQSQLVKALETSTNAEMAQERRSADVLMMPQQEQPASFSPGATQWPGQPDIASAIAAADIAASSAAAAAAAATATDAATNPQEAALAAHVAAAALLAAKLARGAAGLGIEESAAFGSLNEMPVCNVKSGVSAHLATAAPHSSPPVTGGVSLARRKSAQDAQQAADVAGKPAATTPVDAEENLDKISAGKRMRKSAVPQDSPIDPIRDSATKRVKRRPSVLASPATASFPS
ncbi:hypothetical protein Emag_000263 [Eimeria magna]